MITKKELNTYKRILGKNWSRKVLDYFERKDYKRDSGKDYILQDIINFFNGRYNLSTHIKVMEAVEYYKGVRAKLDAKRASILEKKSPEL